MQRVLEKYRAKGFTVLAINIFPREDEFVLPFMSNNKYDFLPLKAPDENWAAKTYSIRGTPTNWLMDAGGRVLFRPRLYDKDTQRVLELEVEALLAHAPTN